MDCKGNLDKGQLSAWHRYQFALPAGKSPNCFSSLRLGFHVGLKS